MELHALLALATWRLTKALVDEEGPGDVFGKLRHFLGVRYDEYSTPYAKNIIADMVMCFWCTSFWVGLFWTVIARPDEAILWLVLPFAYSAGAILIEGFLK